MKSVTCARVAPSPSYDTTPSSLSRAFHHSKYGGGSSAFSLAGICASFSGGQRCGPSRNRNSHCSPSEAAKLLNSHICLRRLPPDMRNECKQRTRTGAIPAARGATGHETVDNRLQCVRWKCLPTLSSAGSACTAAGAACSDGRGRASSAAACPPSGGRTPRSSTTARRPRTRASGRGRGEAVAAGAPRRSAWGARRGGPVSGARRPRAGR